MIINLSLPPISPAIRRMNRELRLSLLAVLTGCALGSLLMVLVTLATFLTPKPRPPANAAIEFPAAR